MITLVANCRILNVCKKFLSTTTTAQDMASYLASVYITRPDVRDSQLPQFLDWIQQVQTINL